MEDTRETKPGRLPCINIKCRRTGAMDKFPGSTEIICRKCFRSMPKAMQLRHKQLWKRKGKLERLKLKHADNPVIRAQLRRIEDRLMTVWCRSYWRMFDHFNRNANPEGIETFLAEMGMGK